MAETRDPVCDRCGQRESLHQDVERFCPFYSTFRAAPREPGEAEQLTGVLDWFNGDGESLVYRAILDWAEDGNYNAKHIAQYACEAIARRLRDKLRAARPDAGDPAPPSGTAP